MLTFSHLALQMLILDPKNNHWERDPNMLCHHQCPFTYWSSSLKVVKQALQLWDDQFQCNDFQVTSFPIKLPILCREGTIARRVSLFEHTEVLFPYWYKISEQEPALLFAHVHCNVHKRTEDISALSSKEQCTIAPLEVIFTRCTTWMMMMTWKTGEFLAFRRMCYNFGSWGKEKKITAQLGL